MTGPIDIRGFSHKPLALYPWAGGETVTISGGVTAGTLGRNFYRVHALGSNSAVVWLRGDGGAAAAEAAHSIPLEPGQTEFVHLSDVASVAGTDGDKVHFMPALI